MAASIKPVILVYDKECPVCHAYCRMVRIRKSIGELVLIDAREPSPVMDEITTLGWDIDQGMVLKVEDNLYYGADAIHTLTLLSGPLNIFNRFNYWIFRSNRLSKYLYPLLRTFRNLLLKVLRKTKINNLQFPDNSHF